VCVADVRLACLASSNQVLFGKLRRGEQPFVTGLKAGLSGSCMLYADIQL
jgi:hypothetical protein